MSISASRLRAASARILDQIWAASGWPPRGGITVWRPYEQLRDHQQDAMPTAATALRLAQTGAITPRGTLGPLLTVQPHQPVYDGHKPSAAELVRRASLEAMHRSWARVQQELAEWLETARSDAATAREIFGVLTSLLPDLGGI